MSDLELRKKLLWKYFCGIIRKRLSFQISMAPSPSPISGGRFCPNGFIRTLLICLQKYQNAIIRSSIWQRERLGSIRWLRSFFQLLKKVFFINNLVGIKLPEGPLMMSPDGYYRSFTREVIYKTPDYLKTKILASLNELFPNCKNPIYCGFGNR